MRVARIVIALFLGALALAEGGLRLVGAADFPLFNADENIGYLPRPSQRGAFVGRAWAFNRLSMGVAAEFHPSDRRDILLVGDSIVFGGNHYDQREKLGPELETLSAARVWPIGAPSWALLNELAYLRLYPEVTTGVDEIVFVLNSYDFGPASIWCSDMAHPRHRPMLIVVYLMERLLAGTGCAPVRDEASQDDSVGEWRTFVRAANKPVTVVLFPARREIENPVAWTHAKTRAAALLGNVRIVDVGATWKKEYYRDDIHPTAEGNKVLARIIAHALPPPADP